MKRRDFVRGAVTANFASRAAVPVSPDGKALHYRPADGWFGDAIPFCWDGVYHVFYLKKPEQVGLPTHWAHISSSDLVRWTEHPDPLEGTSLTGSVIEKDGVFHAYYTANGVSHMTSRDLIRWDQDRANPVVPLDPRWYEVAWRDPHVFWNPDAKSYWMLICARTKSDGTNPLTGCLALATSPDLERWTVQPPAWAPQMSTCVECPDLFRYGKKWVLIYFWHETRVRLADSLSGPWQRPPVQAPDSFDLFAGKTMGDGRRRILIGWLPRRSSDSAERTWGGNMLLPREWYLLPHGSPATRCAPEVIRSFGSDATAGRGARVLRPSMSSWTISADSASVALTAGRAALACWTDAPPDYYLHADLRFSPGASAAIFFRGQPAAGTAWKYKTPLDAGYGLHLDPVRGTVSLRKWYQWEQRSPMLEVPFQFPRGRAASIDMVVHGDIFEVFLDERQSLVSRLLEHPSGSLALLAQDGSVAAQNLKLRRLA